MRPILGILLVGACGFPQPADVKPGGNGDANGDDASDGPSSDDASDAPADGPQFCYGTGFYSHCFATDLTGDLTYDVPTNNINTETDPKCLADEMNYCVVAAGTIVVTTAPMHVTGKRPLVMIAKTLIDLQAMLDASSGGFMNVGGGGNPMDCTSPGVPAMYGGGAGGSFVGKGASGGNTGGQPSAALPIAFHGGCPGTVGGKGDGLQQINPGSGGGAILLISDGMIKIRSGGGVTVGGGGGGGGGNKKHGGGGGGSGGIVAFDSPSVASLGSVIANGGGGGQGAIPTAAGGDGISPPLDGSIPSGGMSGAGAIGGNGGYGTVAPKAGASSTDSGGGGGGGGRGAIVLFRTTAISGGTASPTPISM